MGCRTVRERGSGGADKVGIGHSVRRPNRAFEPQCAAAANVASVGDDERYRALTQALQAAFPHPAEQLFECFATGGDDDIEWPIELIEKGI